MVFKDDEYWSELRRREDAVSGAAKLAGYVAGTSLQVGDLLGRSTRLEALRLAVDYAKSSDTWHAVIPEIAASFEKFLSGEEND